MGQIFGNLTNSALADPSNGQLSFNPSGQKIANAFRGQVGTQSTPIASTVDNSGDSFDLPQQDTQASQAKIAKPSFLQAVDTGQGGTPSATSPALTTKGKLLSALMQEAQGAAAGWAAGRQGNPREGYGGPAAGFQAAQQLPFLQAQQQQGATQGQAQTVFLPPQLAAGLQAKNLANLQAARNYQLSGEMVTVTDPQTGTHIQIPMSQASKIFPSLVNAGAKTQSAQIGANSRQNVAQINQGMMIPITPAQAKEFNLPDGTTQVPLKQYGELVGAAMKQVAPVAGANDTYLVDKGSGDKKALDVGSRSLGSSQNKIVEIADPNNPGNITYTTAGQAMKTGASAPQSAASQTAKATARAIAPGGKVGEEINAFNTAIAHADLLTQAVNAMGNGDQQTLNGLKNRFNNEFGKSGPITAQAISDAYQREVTKMLSGGHMTDSEIDSVGKTLDTNRQSPAQTLAVINSYKQLAASKMQQRQNQVQMGMQGKAAFPSNSSGVQVTDPRGVVHTFPNQQAADSFRKAAGIQ